MNDRPPTSIVRPLSVALALAVAGCEFDPPSKEYNPLALLPDGGMPVDVPMPVLDRATPTTTPYPLLPLRGTIPPDELGNQDSRYVIIEGAGDTPLIDDAIRGPFCTEALLPEPGVYDISVRAQDRRGRLSLPTTIRVIYDPTAPPLLALTNCRGTREDLAGCVPYRELCGNATDDDCDGISDEREPDCRPSCGYDSLEPWSSEEAFIESGRYEALSLCEGPAESDRYRFRVLGNQAVEIRTRTESESQSLNLEIFDSEGQSLFEVAAARRHDIGFNVADALGEEVRPFSEYELILELRAGGSLETEYALELITYTATEES